MPYDIVKVKGGYQVVSPNHPKGHSKKPMTQNDAVAQMLIMKQAEGDKIAETAGKLHKMRMRRKS